MTAPDGERMDDGALDPLRQRDRFVDSRVCPRDGGRLVWRGPDDHDGYYCTKGHEVWECPQCRALDVPYVLTKCCGVRLCKKCAPTKAYCVCSINRSNPSDVEGEEWKGADHDPDFGSSALGQIPPAESDSEAEGEGPHDPDDLGTHTENPD